MNFNSFASFCLFIAFAQLSYGAYDDQWFTNNPTTRLLEIQLQNSLREQEQMTTRLIRNGVQQTQVATNQLLVTKSIQTTAANAIASKGLFDLNNIERLIWSSDIRECYKKNRFTFGDALNTARDLAGQCFNDKLNEGKSIIEEAKNNIQSAVENIGNGAQLLIECSKITNKFPSPAGLVAKGACLQEAMLQIKSNAILLPINIGERILDASKSINAIETDIIKCNLNILKAIATQATYAGQAIVRCVSEAANNGTTNASSSAQ